MEGSVTKKQHLSTSTMWRKALTGILRPSQSEWEQLSVFTKWLIATRYLQHYRGGQSPICGSLSHYYLLHYKHTHFLFAIRAAVLIITFLPACMLGLFAYRAGSFDFTLWLLVTLGLVLAHATNNLLNDIVDWTKGVDKDNYFRYLKQNTLK